MVLPRRIASPRDDTVAGILLALGALFGMGTFFFLAGAFLPAAVRRRGAGGLLRERLVRLGWPTLAFVAVVVPLVQLWVTTETRSGTSANKIWAQQLRELDAGPLWFVWVLLLFTFIAVPVLAAAPEPRPAPLRPRLLIATGCAGSSPPNPASTATFASPPVGCCAFHPARFPSSETVSVYQAATSSVEPRLTQRDRRVGYNALTVGDRALDEFIARFEPSATRTRRSCG